ncbi:uncharacterized protein ASPGLDRAFT_37442 [Aspergillus glaucus CBS 516.65]|uniref:tyrosine--tRNA ligase n=1 Tax=Aspergillus glaucus CBS 516.65 TaxID=1160497 RepID=A0A1L9VDZ5_ASPGL|nr:hypothetical protein ASPGLDRAFT_37442 [Aspergillus glaucus CBS 516.65]OJJ82140.1 hypothetical protein ASPGLDRAFT_37442 [Aspergillus glaucus CBS 516.65]
MGKGGAAPRSLTEPARGIQERPEWPLGNASRLWELPQQDDLMLNYWIQDAKWSCFWLTHAFLENLKAPIELVENRAKYYQKFITAILEAVGVSTDKLEVVLGGSYQKSPNYIMDVYRLSSLVSELDAKKAGAEILKQSSNARLSGLLYPILQVLDEEYLRADTELGGMDQRKLFMAATEWFPKLGYRTRANLITPMVAGLSGGKMSSSDQTRSTSSTLLRPFPRKSLKQRRLLELSKNSLIALVEFIFLSAAALEDQKEFQAERKDTEPLIYTDIKQLKDDYTNDIEITLKAYPPPVAEKKQKKVKDKGSRYPGANKEQDIAGRSNP